MHVTIEQFAKAKNYGKWYAAKYPETDSTTLLSIEYQHLVYLINRESVWGEEMEVAR